MRFSRNVVAVCVVVLVVSGCASVGSRRELKVNTAFPGGSAKVESIDHSARIVRIIPTPHPGRGWDAWWYFKLDGLRTGETLTLDVGKAPWATPDQAVFSVDGHTWTQTPPGVRSKDRIVYRINVPGRSVWFAWGPPYVLADAQRLVDETARRCAYARSFVLTRSAEGRAVPALRIAAPGVPENERLGIWVNARQHAWESGSSWVASGFLNWLTSDDPRAKSLRGRAVIYFVPIMDVDNVERGAGGKNQEPHDHNRDWSDGPHWPEVAAAQERIIELNTAGRMDLFIDLHNPAAGDKQPFFFAAPAEILSDLGQKNLFAFLEAGRAEITGPLALDPKPRESGPAYDKNWTRISKNWVTLNCRQHVVAVTLETSWNNPASTAENYQQVGRELGLAVERFSRASGR